MTQCVKQSGKGRRRVKGEGSIYQRASDGMFVGAISIGGGKRRVVYGSTRGEVRERLDVLAKEVEAGVFSPSRDTFGAYLTRWLETVRPSLRANTYACYEKVLRISVRPYLATVPLGKVTPLLIEGWLTSLRNAGASDRRRQLAFAVVRAALKKAVRWRLLLRSPTDGVDAPRAERPAFKTWTGAEAARFLAAVRGDRTYGIWALALQTGMRIGELLALRWDHVDLGGGVIRVEWTTVEGDDGLTVAPPKSKASRRSISIDGEVVSVLRRQRERLMAEGLAASELVFPTTVGTHYRLSNVRRVLVRAAAVAVVPRIRIHDLRHTNATMLLSGARMDPKTVQGRLGHSSPMLTLGTYGKFTPEADRVAAREIARLVPVLT